MPDPRTGKAETHVYDDLGLQALDWVTAPPAGTAPNGKATGPPSGTKVIPIAKKQPGNGKGDKGVDAKGQKGKGKNRRGRGAGKGKGAKANATLVPRKDGAKGAGGRTVSINDE